jgi:hypothetical protein
VRHGQNHRNAISKSRMETLLSIIKAKNHDVLGEPLPFRGEEFRDPAQPLPNVVLPIMHSFGSVIKNVIKSMQKVYFTEATTAGGVLSAKEAHEAFSLRSSAMLKIERLMKDEDKQGDSHSMAFNTLKCRILANHWEEFWYNILSPAEKVLPRHLDYLGFLLYSTSPPTEGSRVALYLSSNIVFNLADQLDQSLLAREQKARTLITQSNHFHAIVAELSKFHSETEVPLGVLTGEAGEGSLTGGKRDALLRTDIIDNPRIMEFQRDLATLHYGLRRRSDPTGKKQNSNLFKPTVLSNLIVSSCFYDQTSLFASTFWQVTAILQSSRYGNTTVLVYESPIARQERLLPTLKGQLRIPGRRAPIRVAGCQCTC